MKRLVLAALGVLMGSAVLASACFPVFDQEGQPCDQGNCLTGYACVMGKCMHSDGGAGGGYAGGYGGSGGSSGGAGGGTATCDGGCPSTHDCARGTCYPKRCGNTPCATGAVCPTTTCVSNSCVGVTCDAGTVCAQGVCESATCGSGFVCGGGRSCRSGQCVDVACLGLTCPTVFPDAGADAGADGGADAGADAGQRMRCESAACVACDATELSCGDGVDNDCDGTTDCADSTCNGLGCNDNNECTQGERCSGSLCTNPTTTVTCNAPGLCQLGDGGCNPATGACVYPGRPDGTACDAGVAALRCCTGACVDIGADRGNCGGCGLSCATGRTCQRVEVACGAAPLRTSGQCSCAGDAGCPASQNCNVDAGLVCAPNTSGSCASGQLVGTTGTCASYCRYP